MPSARAELRALGPPAVGPQSRRVRVRLHRDAKRAVLPFINGEIIAASDTGDLALTLSVIERHMSEMNLVNVATALHRLAKLVANNTATRAALQEDSVVAQLVHFANALLEKSRASKQIPQCQVLSNISWAFATLQIPNLPLLEAIAQLSCRRVADFKSFELSSTLWAFASFAEEDIKTVDCFTGLFEASENYIGCHMYQFSFRCLVRIMWALATVGQHSEHLFLNMAAAMMKDVHSANTQEMTKIVWSFGKIGTCPNQLFTTLAKKAIRSLGDFRSTDLFNMLWGFAVNGFWYENLFLGAATTLQMQQIHESQVAKLFAAMSSARPRHPTTQAVLCLLLPYCWPPNFTPEDLSHVLLAVARCFGEYNTTCDITDIRSGTGASPAWGRSEVSIKSTPLQVSSFMQSCLHYLPSCMDSLSTQVLADIALSFGVMKLEGIQDLLPMLGKEALVRRSELEVPALLTLLQCLLTVQNKVAGIAVRLFFAEACRRVKDLELGERQRLTYLCAEAELAQQKCTISCEELEMRCRNLSKSYAVAAQQEVKQLQEEQSISSDQNNGQQLETSHPPVKNTCNVEQRVETQVQQPETPRQPTRRAGSKLLPPPLDFVPQYISLECLQCYREDYQRFRSGHGKGAKGEVSSRVTRVTDLERSKVIKRLMPPLDFIPPDVSREKLEAYRTDYQLFRAGLATGAKGEVEKVVNKDEPHFISLDNLASVGQEYTVAQAPMFHSPNRTAANRGSASSTSLQFHRTIGAAPEHPTHAEGTHMEGAESSSIGSEDKDAWHDRQSVSWDSKDYVPFEMSPLYVKNTFLHLAEDGDDDPDEEEHMARLPPPLSFLPSTVSADNIRLGYQKFRTLKSSEASGMKFLDFYWL